MRKMFYCLVFAFVFTGRLSSLDKIGFDGVNMLFPAVTVAHELTDTKSKDNTFGPTQRGDGGIVGEFIESAMKEIAGKG